MLNRMIIDIIILLIAQDIIGPRQLNKPALNTTDHPEKLNDIHE